MVAAFRTTCLRRLPLVVVVLCVARANEYSTRTPVDLRLNRGAGHLQEIARLGPRDSGRPDDVHPPTSSGDGSPGPVDGGRMSSPVVNLEAPRTSRGKRGRRDHRNERSLDLTSDVWEDPGKQFNGAARTFARRVWPAIQELVVDNGISSHCVSGLFAVYAGLRRYQRWALNFVDASGRLPSGLLDGTVSDLGAYDQCQDIGAAGTAQVLEGSYCTVRWNLSGTAFAGRLASSTPSPGGVRHLFDNIRLGLCVPSLCSASHIQAVIDRVLLHKNVSAIVSSCHSRRDFAVSRLQLFLICLLCIWVTVIASLSAVHVLWNFKKAGIKETKSSPVVRLVVAVSVVTSLTRLVEIDRSKHYSKAVDVLKVISVLWITLGMTYQSRLSQDDALRSKGWGRSAVYSVASSSDLGFTTAFLLSGFLVGPSLPPLSLLNGGILRRLATSLSERYIRLTVPALFVLAVFWLLPLAIDGPLADELLRPKLEACRRHWWTVPLHVNNLRGADQVCYSPLWYVSCEMQIFLVTCFILVILSRFPKVATVSLVILCFGLIVGLCAGAFSSSSAASISSPTLPFLHAPAYIVGVLLAKYANKMRHFTQVTLAVLYSCSCVGFLLGLFWPLVRRRSPQLQSPPGAVLSLVGIRCLWGLCVASIIYVTSTRGRTKSDMAQRMLVPLGRLCFGAYLCTWLLVATPAGIAARHPSESGQFVLLREFAANSILSYAAAFSLYLLCDAPTKSICAFLRRRGGADPSSDELDKRVRFLSQLLGVEPTVAPRAAPHKALQRIASLKDIVLHL